MGKTIQGVRRACKNAQRVILHVLPNPQELGTCHSPSFIDKETEDLLICQEACLPGVRINLSQLTPPHPLGSDIQPRSQKCFEYPW